MGLQRYVRDVSFTPLARINRRWTLIAETVAGPIDRFWTWP